MNIDYLAWAEETRKLVRKYSTVSPELDMILNLIVFHAQRGNPDDAEHLKQLIEKQLQAIYTAMILDIPSLPVPEASGGEILLGNLFQGESLLHEFKAPIKDFNRHAAIFASAGHGKTTLLINILHQLLEHGINFLVFDFKQDFRHLKHLPIICLRWNWLRINPFRAPPGVDEFHWIALVCNVFAHVYGWFHASKNYLFEFVNQQYQQSKGSSFVTLQKVKQAIESRQDREFERQRMKTVVLNRISTLLEVCHDVLDCEQGFPIEELLNYPAVIELDECETDEANFLVALFLTYVFEYRKAQQQRGSLKHAIVFDEAHRIFYRQSEYRETEVELGSSVINQIPRIIRDYNEGLIFATQEPSQINNSVMANADLKLVGYLGNGIDIEVIERAFQLDDEDTQIIKRLKLGQFMVQKSGINEGSPFLLQGYDYPVEKSVTDEQLKQGMKDFIAKVQSEPKKTPQTLDDAIQLPKISHKAAMILEHIGKTPLRNLSQRYRELMIHPAEGKKAVSELVDSKMIVVKPIQLSAGRPSIYLEPTAIGKVWLRQNNVNYSVWEDYVGHVGLEHRVYQWLIANALKKQGYSVRKECTIGSKRLDVYAEKITQSEIRADQTADGKAERRLGVEVCISPKLNFSELSKIESQLDEVVFACKDLSVIQTMQRQMAELKLDNPKFKFYIGYRYLEELYSTIQYTENNENNSNETQNGHYSDENNPEKNTLPTKNNPGDI